MPECEVLAKKLKELRKMMDLSQMELAAECGISTETLSLLERQKVDPKLSTIQKIAAFANCEVVDLLKVERGDKANCIYKLGTGYVFDEDGNAVVTYGIVVVDSDGNIFETIPDVFLDQMRAERFIHLCNAEKLELIHLPDVIEDELF